MLGPYVKAINIIEPPVPRFGDDGQRPPVARGVRLAVRNAPLNYGIAHDADAVRVRDHHRSFEKAGFFDPRRSRHLAVSVERPPAGEDGVHHGLFAAGKNRSDSGADGAFADLQFSLAGDQGHLADFHTLHVRDGVERAGRAVKRDTKIPCTRLASRLVLRKDVSCEKEHTQEEHESFQKTAVNHSCLSQAARAVRSNSVLFRTACSSNSVCSFAAAQSPRSAASVNPGNSRCA